MEIKSRLRGVYTGGRGTVVIIGFLLVLSGCGQRAPEDADQIADTPDEAGKALYAQYCESCHGVEAMGSQQGPPFIDIVYEPNHHGDEAFISAAMNGVSAHHWPFGDMPPVEGITEAEIRPIIAYVRALQREAGIE